MPRSASTSGSRRRTFAARRRTPRCWRKPASSPRPTRARSRRASIKFWPRSRPGHSNSRRALEDVHMNVESRLKELIGAAAGRLHTARSRNDQVATDFRLYVRDAIDGIDAALEAVQRALAEKAEAHAATVMPGFTHLQPAQPVTFGHHLLAYVEMIARDRGALRRCQEAAQRMSARLGGAGRHVVSDRSAENRRSARLRPADGELARRRLGSRFRARRRWPRRRSRPCISRASPKRSSSG